MSLNLFRYLPVISSHDRAQRSVCFERLVLDMWCILACLMEPTEHNQGLNAGEAIRSADTEGGSLHPATRP